MNNHRTTSSCGLNPAGTKVLIRLEQVEQKTASGLILVTKEEPEQQPIGIVEKISAEIPKERLSFKVGDRVLFEKGLNYDIHEGAEDTVKYTLVSYYDVIAVLDKKTVIETINK